MVGHFEHESLATLTNMDTFVLEAAIRDPVQLEHYEHLLLPANIDTSWIDEIIADATTESHATTVRSLCC